MSDTIPLPTIRAAAIETTYDIFELARIAGMGETAIPSTMAFGFFDRSSG